MQFTTKRKILTTLIFAIIFSMSQQTNAQTKKSKGKKTVASAAAEAKPVAPEISYTVSMSKPWTHLLEVEMRLKSAAPMASVAEIQMPVWTPGSYLIREYARHVQDFAAADGNGRELTWRKTNKNTWQIDAKGASEIVVKYNVYANELTVRTNDLNDEHAFFNNGALLMNPIGFMNAPSTVKVIPYGNWKVATGLPKVAGQTNTFRAANFDILYDSPFEVGDFKEISFDVQGKPHRIIFEGEGNYDMAKIAADTKKIVEETVKMFGDVPYEDYLFIVNTRGGGGLEHLNSTALQFNRLEFTTRYKSFLSLVAHEFFHAWNVKRIRPDALGPFDYNNENYTRLLWVAEGATAYYESVLLRRAGLMTEKEFFDTYAANFRALQVRPGRFQTSLEEASFDAWIKFYRPDENAINNQISYYDKGEIVSFLLDLQIRKDSNGAKSLDDVMRYLYAEFSKRDKNYTPEDFQKTAEMMAGKSLEDFFARYVRGRAEIDYNQILNSFGLQLTTIGSDAAQKAYLGANLAQTGERLNITSIPADTPAYEQGLNANDQIVAVDGNRATQAILQTYLDGKKPGDKIRLTVFRYDRMRDIEITLGGQIKPDYKIAALASPTDEQKRLYQNYFGAEIK